MLLFFINSVDQHAIHVGCITKIVVVYISGI